MAQAVYNELTGEWEEPENLGPPPVEETQYAWTDPDNAMPDWLHDPNGIPPGIPGPDNEWYWDGSMWNVRHAWDINRDRPQAAAPPPAPTTYGGGGGYYGGGGRVSGGGGGGFAWPRFNAPQYTPGAPMAAPPPFEYEAFKQPEFSDIYKDGSYKGRRDEGLQAIEHGAAAKGLTRLPATQQELGKWNQDFASREFGNIFDRAANTWTMNRNNAADNYSKNYGISRDVWDRNEQQNLSTYDRNYRAALDMFDRNEFEPSKLTFDDMYRRWRDELDANTRIATGNYD